MMDRASQIRVISTRSSGERGQVDDIHELVGFEAGATNQGAVNVGLGDEGGEVVGGDAAAVLNLEALGDGLAGDVGNRATDHCDRGIGAFWGCGAASADGPDGFVGDDHRGYMVNAVQGGADLAADNGLGVLRFVLGESFADAQDRDQTIGKRGLQFAIDQGVVLTEVLAAFGVPQDDVGRQALQHCR